MANTASCIFLFFGCTVADDVFPYYSHAYQIALTPLKTIIILITVFTLLLDLASNRCSPCSRCPGVTFSPSGQSAEPERRVEKDANSDNFTTSCSNDDVSTN